LAAWVQAQSMLVLEAVAWRHHLEKIKNQQMDRQEVLKQSRTWRHPSMFKVFKGSWRMCSTNQIWSLYLSLYFMFVRYLLFIYFRLLVILSRCPQSAFNYVCCGKILQQPESIVRTSFSHGVKRTRPFSDERIPLFSRSMTKDVVVSWYPLVP
jgi:hypothetical protein